MTTPGPVFRIDLDGVDIVAVLVAEGTGGIEHVAEQGISALFRNEEVPDVQRNGRVMGHLPRPSQTRGDLGHR